MLFSVLAVRKRELNKRRGKGEKYAEIQRVRLGSRLLAYLPSRVNDGLIEVLKRFREKAEQVGIQQFFIQTHFESPLEVTEEVIQATRCLLEARMDYHQSGRVHGGGFTSGTYGEVERGTESNRYSDVLHFFREGIRGELCLVCPE